jgi:hypothetical protein
VARLAEPAIGAPLRTFAARPRPIVKATDLGSAQVLKHLDLFLVSDAFGDIHPDSRGMGLYDGDTRVLSCSVLHIAGERPVILHSDPGGRLAAWSGANPVPQDPGDKMGADDRILRQTISVAAADHRRAYRERLDIRTRRSPSTATSRSGSTPTTPTSSRSAATRDRPAGSCCRSR